MEGFYGRQNERLMQMFDDFDDVVWLKKKEFGWEYTMRQTIVGWILGAARDNDTKSITVGATSCHRCKVYYRSFLGEIVLEELKKDKIHVTAQTSSTITLSNGTRIVFKSLKRPKEWRGLVFDLCIAEFLESDMPAIKEALLNGILPVMKMKGPRSVFYVVEMDAEEERVPEEETKKQQELEKLGAVFKRTRPLCTRAVESLRPQEKELAPKKKKKERG